jgi:hypothetical protein
MNLACEFDRESDGRWIAEMPAIPGVMGYGQTREEALTDAFAIAPRVLAEKAAAADASQTARG